MSRSTPPLRPDHGDARARRRRRAVVSALAAFAVVIPLAVGNGAQAVSAPEGWATALTPRGQVDLLRVTTTSAQQARRLVNSGYDLAEHRAGRDYFVVGDAATLRQLRNRGFTVRVERTLRPAGASIGARDRRKAVPGVYPTFYGGYRTVDAHQQHLTDVEAARPDLAKVIDYGDSWRKQQGLGGQDLRAICLTKQQPGDCALTPSTSKPRTIVIAAIHARELSTAEMAWRWIDHLVNNYEVLPDVTTLLDHQELWVVPVANPDGRQIVESGGSAPYLQRKNANTTDGSGCVSPPTVSNQAGVDLNRNATFKWGGAGASTLPCDQTYRGTGAASEPEQQALETLFGQLFADTRGPNNTDAASSTTSGAVLSLHSYSNLTLLPWGWTTTLSPNNAGLRSLAFRMSYYNGYRTGTGPEILYSTTGTTDDHTYGTLGVPSFTIEVGPATGSCGGFIPPYSCVDGTFWPLMRDSMVALAKNSRTPYVDSTGPNTTSASASVTGTTVTVTGTANDNAYGSASGSVGRPATQRINAARYFLDIPPWAGGTAVVTMSATDGTFNATSEGIRATQSTTGLASGRHTLYVQSRDTSGTWGPVTSAWFTVP
ncbi:MAG: M14 family zinc carboxypeptidase [Angustibacter sp.]